MREWLIVAALVVAAAVGVAWLRTQLLIDACLDSGGRWNNPPLHASDDFAPGQA
jgi:hypothetical protein